MIKVPSFITLLLVHFVYTLLFLLADKSLFPMLVIYKLKIYYASN